MSRKNPYEMLTFDQLSTLCINRCKKIKKLEKQLDIAIKLLVHDETLIRAFKNATIEEFKNK